MKRIISKYILAILVLVYFSGAGLIPVYSILKGNNGYSLQKNNSANESANSETSGEIQQKEYFSQYDGILLAPLALELKKQKYFIPDFSMHLSCYFQVITPPPDMI